MERVISTSQFTDEISMHEQRLFQSMEEKLSPNILEIVDNTRQKVRSALQMEPSDLIVVFGEQAYGLNETPKVLGKRLFAKGLELEGATPIELFASYDIAGSEAGIYRMQLPNPQSSEGYVSINMLPGWGKKKNVSTSGFRTPTIEDLKGLFSYLDSNYGNQKASNVRDYYHSILSNTSNYAESNIYLLREFEKQIGLEIDRSINENSLDTLIAVAGGMEVMVSMWPEISKEAKRQSRGDVKIPEVHETPFFVYHGDGCHGRMNSNFTGSNLGMESQINCKCMHCGKTEITSPSEIVDQRRFITWRAIPRVIAYSTLFADGHITGGGSVYNNIAEPTANSVGLSYFPITHMQNKTEPIFQYKSSATLREKLNNTSANEFVREGSAAMLDLILSIGVDQLRCAIEDKTGGINTNTKITFDEKDTLTKNNGVIAV